MRSDKSDDEKVKTTPLRMPPDLRARFDRQVEKDRRGVHDEVLVLLDEALTRREAVDTGRRQTPKIRLVTHVENEMIQAIVGMWRKVGIDATIEVYEIAKHYELRAAHKLAPAAFYNWGNAIGDPSTSTGFSMFGPSPHSSWKGQDTIDLIGPLWGEPDEAKRIAGYKAVQKHIADEGEVIPLLQYVQPIIARKGITVVPQSNGMLLPALVKPA